MRNLIYSISLTLDGCCDHMKQTVSDEGLDYLDYFVQLLRGADIEVFGRKTWQLMVPYWPDVLQDPASTKDEIEFAQAFVDIKKVVFSRTLKNVEEPNTRFVDGDLSEEILKLKNEPGRDILLGGVDLASQVIRLGLVDEYRIVIAPIVAGEGRRLMEGVNLPEQLKVKLVDSKVFESGRVVLRYRKP